MQTQQDIQSSQAVSQTPPHGGQAYSSILSYLTALFSDDGKNSAKNGAISHNQLCRFLNISRPTAWRYQKKGQYPRVVRIGNSERIFLCDLASFIVQGGKAAGHKQRGRPVGSKNRPKGATEASEAGKGGAA